MADKKEMKKMAEVAEKGTKVDSLKETKATKKAKKDMEDLVKNVPLEENNAYLELLHVHEVANQLVQACGEGKTKKVEELLKDVDPNIPDDNTGMYALGVAKTLEIVKLLVKKGADMEIKNTKGETPIHQQMRIFKEDKMEYFLKEGININFPDGKKKTLIYYAAEYDNTKAIKWCLKKGADLDHEDGLGLTPFLHAADVVERNTKKALEMLIKEGSSKYAVNRLGQSALQIMMENKKPKNPTKQQLKDPLYVPPKKKGPFSNGDGLSYLKQLFEDVDIDHVANSEIINEGLK